MKITKAPLAIVAAAIGSALYIGLQTDYLTESTGVLRATEISAGQQAYIDPVSGQLTNKKPTNSASDEPPQNLASERLPEIQYRTHSDGTVQAELHGRFTSHFNVSIGCDGALIQEHSDSTAKPQTNCVEEK